MCLLFPPVIKNRVSNSIVSNCVIVLYNFSGPVLSYRKDSRYKRMINILAVDFFIILL